MHVGTHIKYWRERRGITQKELSVLSKVSTGAISEIEKGINAPKHDTLMKILKGLKISIEDFYLDIQTQDISSNVSSNNKELLDWLDSDKSLPFIEFAFKLYKDGFTPKLLEKVDISLKN